MPICHGGNKFKNTRSSALHCSLIGGVVATFSSYTARLLGRALLSELDHIQLPNATIVLNVVLPEVSVLATRDNCYAEIVTLNCDKIILAVLLVNK